MQRLILMVVATSLILVGDPCHAFQIEIKNNRLTVEADSVPLQDLLKKLAFDHDIAVRMDPAINPVVTVSFQSRELEDGLKSILTPHNHVLLWKRVSKGQTTPSAPAYRLDQIHIFKPGEKPQMVDIKAPLNKIPPEKPPVQETQVTIKGNKVFVPVTLSYNDKEIQTTLLFDTGAGSIVLHQNVAGQLDIDAYEASQGRGVGGVQVQTKVTKLDYVAVGPKKKADLRADIIDYQGPEDADYNGLLGMNFIRGLKYTIDFDNQTIQWLP
jgi:hypothetical protein